MKQLAGYVIEYIRELNRPALYTISILTGLLVFVNYQFRIEASLLRLPTFASRFTWFFLLYLLLFGGSYLVIYGVKNSRSSLNKSWFLPGLVFVAVAIFAWRMSSLLITAPFTQSLPSPWNRYWAIILNPPVKCLLIILVIYVIKFAGRYERDITGLRRPGSLKPFIILLICFVPVIIVSALQPDFRLAYPKAAKISFAAMEFSQPWISALLFEISYAFDFLVVEIFFRGFLVFAFIRYTGPAAILPMASFYCAIHFGKPALECVSSYFGAILLGVITWRTRSVLGGLLLHLGMGWLMEIAGFLLH